MRVVGTALPSLLRKSTNLQARPFLYPFNITVPKTNTMSLISRFDGTANSQLIYSFTLCCPELINTASYHPSGHPCSQSYYSNLAIPNTHYDLLWVSQIQCDPKSEIRVFSSQTNLAFAVSLLGGSGVSWFRFCDLALLVTRPRFSWFLRIGALAGDEVLCEGVVWGEEWAS